MDMFSELPPTIIKSPVPESKWVLLNFLVPTILTTLLYILTFSTQTVLAYEHYIDKHHVNAIVTLAILLVPVFMNFVTTLMWPEMWPENKCTEFAKWICLLVLKHALFPVWSILSFAERLLWSIEAYRFDGDERKYCLKNVSRTHPIELYFFLQAYFEAAPQAIWQLYILMGQSMFIRRDTVYTQIAVIFLSICKVAATGVTYQNYESQKLLGLQYPWSRNKGPYKYLSVNNPAYSEKIFEQINDKRIQSNNALTHSASTLPQDSETQSDYETPRRRPTSPVEQIATIKTKLLKPIMDGFKYTPNNLPMPRRKFPEAGRFQEDAGTRMILFLFWFTFVTSRCLSITACASFFPNAVTYTLIGYFLVTYFTLLFCTRTRKLDRVVVYALLSYVYTFTFIEFRVRYRHFSRSFTFFFVMAHTQNLIFTFLWYIEDMQDFWLDYLLTLILSSMGMSLTFALVYTHWFRTAKVKLYLKDIRFETLIE